jgi:hypothetical protein
MPRAGPGLPPSGRGGVPPPGWGGFGGGPQGGSPGCHKLEAAISDRKNRRRPLALVRSRWRLAARASTQTLPHVSLAGRGCYHRAIPCPSEYLALMFLFDLSLLCSGIIAIWRDSTPFRCVFVL